MRKLLWFAISAGLLAYTLAPQWRSFERMGELRFLAISHPAKEVLVGVYWPFSANQDGMADGLHLALEEINARGIPFRLILREGHSWEEAKQTAIEFSATSNMSAVLGYYDSSEAIKASMMYESSRLLHVIVGANSSAMTTRGLKYIVRTVLASDKIARSLAQWSVEEGRRKFALIWQEDAFGEDLAYQYRVALDKLGGQLVYQWSYSREHVDFRLPVNELKGINADMIFIAGLEPWAGDFLRMARAVGIKTKITGAFTDTPEMRARAGAGLDGVIFFDFYDVNSPSPENQEFVRKFRSRYGKNPDTWAAQGYDALRILAKAVRETGSVNPLDLSYAIRFMDPWEGANGRYKFDDRGELEDKPLYLKEFQNGRPVVIQEANPVPGLLFEQAPG